MPESTVVQYVLTRAMRAHLDAYLSALGFVVDPMPEQDPDALPTFIVSPSEARLRAARAGAPVLSIVDPFTPPVYASTAGHLCAQCQHHALQHLANPGTIGSPVTCSQCDCKTRL